MGVGLGGGLVVWLSFEKGVVGWFGRRGGGEFSLGRGSGGLVWRKKRVVRGGLVFLVVWFSWLVE